MLRPAVAAICILVSTRAAAEEPASPPPTVPLAPLPAAPAPLPAPSEPMLQDRIRTADGREHLGRLIGPVDGGFVFRNHAGAEYVIPTALIVSVERGVPLAAPPQDSPRVLALEPSQKALERTFELYSLQQQREQLTYREKLLLMGLGAVTAAAGFALVPGETGTVIGVLGAAELAGGAIAAAVTWVRERSLDARIESAQQGR